MNRKLTFLVLLTAVFSACKKDQPTSTAITGQWKLSVSYNVTIDGLHTTPANPANPATLKFEGPQYIETKDGKVINSGPYELADHYTFGPGDVDNALKLSGGIRGRYRIGKGVPDTLFIKSALQAIDANSEDVYLKVK